MLRPRAEIVDYTYSYLKFKHVKDDTSWGSQYSKIRWCEGLQRKFCIPAIWECKNFNFFQQQVGFECPHVLWLSTLLKLHLYDSKNIFYRSLPPPKIVGQKSQNQPLRWLQRVTDKTEVKKYGKAIKMIRYSSEENITTYCRWLNCLVLFIHLMKRKLVDWSKA